MSFQSKTSALLTGIAKNVRCVALARSSLVAHRLLIQAHWVVRVWALRPFCSTLAPSTNNTPSNHEDALKKHATGVFLRLRHQTLRILPHDLMAVELPFQLHNVTSIVIRRVSSQSDCVAKHGSARRAGEGYPLGLEADENYIP